MTIAICQHPERLLRKLIKRPSRSEFVCPGRIEDEPLAPPDLLRFIPGSRSRRNSCESAKSAKSVRSRCDSRTSTLDLPRMRRPEERSQTSIDRLKYMHEKMDHPVYMLPNDENEQDRQVSLHFLVKNAFKSNYMAPVRTQLTKGAVVLDVGCGTGAWTMDMATEYPRSKFIGLEISEIFPQAVKPKNCRFLLCDVHERLPFADNSVDYVFQRCLTLAHTQENWAHVMREFYRVLKPGGWLELMESDLQVQQSSYSDRIILDRFNNVLLARNQDPFIARRLTPFLSAHGFRKCDSRFRSLSLEWGGEVGRAFADVNLTVMQSLRSWLAPVIGMSRNEYDELLVGVRCEWVERESFVNFHTAFGQKPRSREGSGRWGRNMSAASSLYEYL